MPAIKKKRSEFQLTPAAFAKLGDLAIYHKKPKSEVVELLIMSEKQDHLNAIKTEIGLIQQQHEDSQRNQVYLAKVNESLIAEVTKLRAEVNSLAEANKKSLNMLSRIATGLEQQNNKPSGLGKLFGG